ncbi:response regulator [Megalodesulfovibrio gigas]|uniref:Sensory/regulatory protein RpfC n=1 Tax=Megalodesulfovibrio gigas (strain ATCC 19364 / DSM 1382 / NCIMB 9332 / VKM B-1759) TaxID=1121448 RepID=T2GDP1_MEGG1|nr:response regulator [Megalodesulfovibrio gigas]AGW14690.1 putative PAS sensor protein [Megalodesulfovibrio gigas DSM 1382 = ATCC 19364]
MLLVDPAYLDKITEAFHLILKGQPAAPIALPPGHPEDELWQVVQYVNRFLEEYGQATDAVFALSRGRLDFAPPPGRLAILASVKSLQSSLRHLTWTTQQIAQGDYEQRVSFMGDFAKAFNTMAQQLQASFQERAESTQALRDQVDELGKARRAMLNIMEDLEVARREADDANKAKSDFLARMSHEIRTPMNAIIGMSHLALQTELTAKQHDYISKIQAAAHNLLGIINDILDFSKIEAGKMEIESIPFRLDEVLDNLANIVSLRAEEKGLEVLFNLQPDVPNDLKGDPLRLGQVFINLANNAIKFTEAGEVVISVGLERQDAATVTLRCAVKDTGIGLSQEQMGRLFQSFSQADGSHTRKYGGTGLGLTICKRLVAMMGGTIWVESEPGQGSTFLFTATLERAAATTPVPYLPAVDLRGMRSLVVDDNPTARAILSNALAAFSFRVTAVESGQDALDELRAAARCGDPYELVLMDWKMPGMNGIDTVRQIRQTPGLTAIPQILMVTAYGREEVMRQAEDVGMAAFLIKPFNQSVLFDTIMGVFGYGAEGRLRRPTLAGQEPEGMDAIRGARILLAEDNEINQQIAIELLEKAGLVVEVANNGLEAVAAAASTCYDLVLMDIQMPEMDGLAATAAIRKLDAPWSASMPVVAMTAHAMSGDRELSLEAGMNDHITKPIDPVQLLTTLVTWIKPGDRPLPQGFVPRSRTLETVLQQEDLPLEGVPGLNIKSGLSKVSGNRSLYRKLLGKFRDKYLHSAAEVAAYLQAGQVQEATRLAHTIKGVAANLGADDLSRASAEVERALKAGHTEVTSLLADMTERLTVVGTSLARLLPAVPAAKAPAPAPTAALDRPAAAALARDIAAAVNDNLTQAMDKLTALLALPFAPAELALAEKAAAYLDNFDTDEAVAELEALAATLAATPAQEA